MSERHHANPNNHEASSPYVEEFPAGPIDLSGINEFRANARAQSMKRSMDAQAARKPDIEAARDDVRAALRSVREDASPTAMPKNNPPRIYRPPMISRLHAAPEGPVTEPMPVAAIVEEPVTEEIRIEPQLVEEAPEAIPEVEPEEEREPEPEALPTIEDTESVIETAEPVDGEPEPESPQVTTVEKHEAPSLDESLELVMRRLKGLEDNESFVVNEAHGRIARMMGEMNGSTVNARMLRQRVDELSSIARSLLMNEHNKQALMAGALDTLADEARAAVGDDEKKTALDKGARALYDAVAGADPRTGTNAEGLKTEALRDVRRLAEYPPRSNEEFRVMLQRLDAKFEAMRVDPRHGSTLMGHLRTLRSAVRIIFGS